jgi:hypothetical protein
VNPRTLPDQFLALRAALAARPGPVGAPELAQAFTRTPRAKVGELLEIIVTLGHARRIENGRYLPRGSRFGEKARLAARGKGTG